MSIFAHKISVNYEEKCFYCRIDGYGDIPKKMYENFPAGIHSMYIGEVVNAWKNDSASRW